MKIQSAEVEKQRVAKTTACFEVGSHARASSVRVFLRLGMWHEYVTLGRNLSKIFPHTFQDSVFPGMACWYAGPTVIYALGFFAKLCPSRKQYPEPNRRRLARLRNGCAASHGASLVSITLLRPA